MKLKCIAIDDEPLALELLEDNIKQVPYLELVAGFNKPMDAMQFMQQQEIDLVFMLAFGVRDCRMWRSCAKVELFITSPPAAD